MDALHYFYSFVRLDCSFDCRDGLVSCLKTQSASFVGFGCSRWRGAIEPGDTSGAMGEPSLAVGQCQPDRASHLDWCCSRSSLWCSRCCNRCGLERGGLFCICRSGAKDLCDLAFRSCCSLNITTGECSCWLLAATNDFSRPDWADQCCCQG